MATFDAATHQSEWEKFYATVNALFEDGDWQKLKSSRGGYSGAFITAINSARDFLQSASDGVAADEATLGRIRDLTKNCETSKKRLEYFCQQYNEKNPTPQEGDLTYHEKHLETYTKTIQGLDKCQKQILSSDEFAVRNEENADAGMGPFDESLNATVVNPPPQLGETEEQRRERERDPNPSTSAGATGGPPPLSDPFAARASRAPGHPFPSLGSLTQGRENIVTSTLKHPISTINPSLSNPMPHQRGDPGTLNLGSNTYARNVWPSLESRSNTPAPDTLRLLRASENALFQRPWLQNNAHLGTGGAEGGAGADALATGRVGRERVRDGEASGLLDMYSQTLASTFRAKNIVGKSFSGQREEFEGFWARWTKCDDIMENMGYRPSAKFLEMLTCLSGNAKEYVVNLSPCNDMSYFMAVKTIWAVYSQERLSLKHLIEKFMAVQRCSDTTESRMRIHSSIVGYKMAVNSLNPKSDDVTLAWELTNIFSKLDDQWKRQFVKFLEKRRDPEAPLGVLVTFDDVVAELHREILENAKFETDTSRSGGGEKRGERFKRGAAAAVSAPISKDTKDSSGKAAKSTNPNPNPQSSTPQRAAAASSTIADAAAAAAAAAAEKAYAAVAAATAGKASYQKGAGTGAGGGAKPKQGPKKVQQCVFCVHENVPQRHAWPRGCPLVKEEKLSAERCRNLVISNRLCKNCFLPHKSFATDCEGPPHIVCGYQGCTMRHHKIFHGRDNFKRNAAAAAAAPATAGRP